MTTWRDRFRPLIAKIIQENEGSDMKTLRKALRAAFPVAPRAFHPYKIWLDEIKVQTGTKKKRLTEAEKNTGNLFEGIA